MTPVGLNMIAEVSRLIAEKCEACGLVDGFRSIRIASFRIRALYVTPHLDKLIDKNLIPFYFYLYGDFDILRKLSPH